MLDMIIWEISNLCSSRPKILERKYTCLCQGSRLSAFFHQIHIQVRPLLCYYLWKKKKMTNALPVVLCVGKMRHFWANYSGAGLRFWISMNKIMISNDQIIRSLFDIDLKNSFIVLERFSYFVNIYILARKDLLRGYLLSSPSASCLSHSVIGLVFRFYY